MKAKGQCIWTVSLAICKKIGWMTSKVFLQYLQHLVKYTHCAPKDHVLTIWDGHSLHTIVCQLWIMQHNMDLCQVCHHTVYLSLNLNINRTHIDDKNWCTDVRGYSQAYMFPNFQSWLWWSKSLYMPCL